MKKKEPTTYYYVLTEGQKNFKKVVKKILKPILEEMKTEPKLSSTILEIIFCWRNKQKIVHTKYLTLFGIQERL